MIAVGSGMGNCDRKRHLIAAVFHLVFSISYNRKEIWAALGSHSAVSGKRQPGYTGNTEKIRGLSGPGFDPFVISVCRQILCHLPVERGKVFGVVRPQV